MVGSGPAGLAAAQQLTRAGHTVAVYERDDRIGGLLRYGIPDFKMEKKQLEPRLAQMQAEGTRFRAGVEIGVDISWDDLKSRYDAVVVATGAMVPRDLPDPGSRPARRALRHGLPRAAEPVGAGDIVADQLTAEGKHVVVLGGGDTGADCIGTAHRQGALSVTNLAIGIQPPAERPEHQPWPMYPNLFEVSSAHEEGGERVYLASTVEFLSNEVGRGPRHPRRRDRVPRRPSRAEVGHRARDPRRPRAARARLHRARATTASTEQLSLPFDDRGNLARDEHYETSRVRRVRRRATPAAASRSSSGRSPRVARRHPPSTGTSRATTELPFPVKPTDRAIVGLTLTASYA